MKDLQLFKFKGQDVRVVWSERKNDWYYVLVDTCKILEIGNPSDVVKRLDPQGVTRIEVADARGIVQKTTCISKAELARVVTRSNKKDAIELACILGLETNTLFYATKEQHTLSIISAAFSHVEQETQHFVGIYKIDLYFPKYRIAVECDENGHNHYSRCKEIERQHFIEDELGCIFIRYNPDADDFNVGTVINRIMRAIYGN